MISSVTPLYNISYEEQVSDDNVPTFNLKNNEFNVIKYKFVKKKMI